jgi:hypothetical protein
MKLAQRDTQRASLATITKKPRGQEQNALEQREHGADTNAHKAKRQRDKPEQGSQDQDCQRHRRRENEQDAPDYDEAKKLHGMLLCAA